MSGWDAWANKLIEKDGDGNAVCCEGAIIDLSG